MVVEAINDHGDYAGYYIKGGVNCQYTFLISR
jgi:hypothetical protein